MSNIFIGLKKTCLGVLERRNRDKDNAIGLKKGRVIKIETTVLPLRDARSLSLCIYSPLILFISPTFHLHSPLRLPIPCLISRMASIKGTRCFSHSPASSNNRLLDESQMAFNFSMFASAFGNKSNVQKKATQEQCCCKL